MRKYPVREFICCLIVLFVACKKDDDDYIINAPYNNEVPYGEYSGNLLPVEGSCIDTAGNLLFFQFPFLSSPNIPIISAKILKAVSNNSNSVVFDFQGQTFSYCSYNGIHYNGQNGLVPSNGCASLAMTDNGNLYMSYSNKHTIYRIAGNGYYSQWMLNGVVAISAFNNKIYAATGPIYNNSYNILQLPRIYVMGSPGSLPTLYYEFPSSINFNNYSGGLNGSGNILYPIVYSMSLKMDTDSSLYVAFGYDDVVYKIDKNKNLTTYVSTIPYPTSIDITANGIMYVASAPGFSMDSTYHITMNKPPRVFSVQQGIPNQIYEGALFTPLYSTGNTINDPMHRITNSFYSISATSSNKVYLVSPAEAKIVRVI